jgi:hypothetical protein
VDLLALSDVGLLLLLGALYVLVLAGLKATQRRARR